METTQAADLRTLDLSQIASLIRRDWTSQTKKSGEHIKVNYAAKPYLDAMACLTSVDDRYGCDSGTDMVLYFLANAQTYKGETAKAIKAELKRRVGLK